MRLYGEAKIGCPFLLRNIMPIFTGIHRTKDPAMILLPHYFRIGFAHNNQMRILAYLRIWIGKEISF